MRRRFGWLDLLAWGLLVFGGLALAQSLAVAAKAELGQWLISQAWEGREWGEAASQPWPWADTRPVARLVVPAHGVELFVLEGGTGHALAWGPGHLAGTAPVGSPGNAVLAGHRDTHFAFLRELAIGDEIRAEDLEGHERGYRVVAAFVTDERDPRVLDASDSPLLTLVTCWPFDTPVPGGPQRYVVVADADRQRESGSQRTSASLSRPAAAILSRGAPVRTLPGGGSPPGSRGSRPGAGPAG